MSIVWQKTLNFANTGAGGYSFRNIHAGIINGTITQFRVRFASHPTLPVVIDAAAIGVRSSNFDTTATPWPILVGGTPGVTIPPATEVWSDWIVPASPLVNPGAFVSIFDYNASGNGHQNILAGSDGFGYKSGATASQANVSGVTLVAGRSTTIDRIEVVLSAPPAYGTIVDEKVANFSSYIDLIDTTGFPCDRYMLEFFNAVSDIETPPNAQSGALLTAYLSTNGGQSFHTGPHYNNTGISNFPGEANPAFLPQPFALGTPQTLTMGIRLSADTGDRAGYGATGICHIFNADVVNGNPVNTIYQVDGYKGAIGGLASTVKPASLGGGPWFPADGNAPFHWAVPISYAGHFDGAPGLNVNAFRLKMDGGGTTGALIESGKFKLRRMD